MTLSNAEEMRLTVMVFVPFPLAAASSLRDGGGQESCRGFAPTPSLRRAVAAADDDEADFAALNAAGVAALDGLGGGRRLVLAAEVEDRQVRDQASDLGEVEVQGLSWRQVQSLFSDQEVAGPFVAGAAQAATGVPLADAFGLPTVVRLTDSHDLLWYAPEELDGLR